MRWRTFWRPGARRIVTWRGAQRPGRRKTDTQSDSGKKFPFADLAHATIPLLAVHGDAGDSTGAAHTLLPVMVPPVGAFGKDVPTAGPYNRVRMRRNVTFPLNRPKIGCAATMRGRPFAVAA